MSGFREGVRHVMRLLTADASLPRRSTPWRIATREAESRGYQLLVENLSPSQRVQYQAYGHFDVIGGDTGTRYRIRRGYQLNIEELDKKGRRARLLCFMPEGAIPLGDVMLAQKIALELFESDAVGIANRFPAWETMAAAQIAIARRHLHR